jgi:hypothetical protein
MTSVARQVARHWPRLTLAVLWAIGGEVLAWSFQPDRSALDWLLVIAGYIALAYALCDLAVRWNLRDLYGVAALGGLAALLHALLLNPQMALVEIPRTLVTRALGAQGILLMGMLLMWLILLGVLPLRRLMLPVAVVMGLCWGTWVRYAPVLTDLRAPVIGADGFTLVGVGCVLAIMAMAAIGRTQPVTESKQLLIDTYEAGFIATVAIALLYRQFDRGAIDTISRGVVVGLIGICLAMQWFRKDSTRSYFARPIQVGADWPLLIGSLIAFLICAVVAFNTSIIGDETLNQLSVVVLIFGVFGLTWLPGVAAILGLRAVLREVSATQL